MKEMGAGLMIINIIIHLQVSPRALSLRDRVTIPLLSYLRLTNSLTLSLFLLSSYSLPLSFTHTLTSYLFLQQSRREEMIPAHASCILLLSLLLVLFITTCTTTTLAANTTYIPIVLMHGVAQGNDALAIVVQWINGTPLISLVFLPPPPHFILFLFISHNHTLFYFHSRLPFPCENLTLTLCIAAMPGAYVHNMEIGNGSKDSVSSFVHVLLVHQ